MQQALAGSDGHGISASPHVYQPMYNSTTPANGTAGGLHHLQQMQQPNAVAGYQSNLASYHSATTGPPGSNGAWSSMQSMQPPQQQGYIPTSQGASIPRQSLPGSGHPSSAVASGGYSSGGCALPMPPFSSSDGSAGAKNAASGRAFNPVLNAPMPQAPISCPSLGDAQGLGSNMGLGTYYRSTPVPMPSDAGSAAAALAGPKAASMAAAAVAKIQESPLGMQASGSLVNRPKLGENLYCSCPMVCVVGTNHGAPHAVPLNIMNLQFNVHCHISQAFVELQLVAHYPLSWNDAPLVFFLPKTTDTTITELVVDNLVRPSVFATAVVPLDDMKKFGGKGGAGHGGGAATAAGEPDDAAIGTDPELFLLPLPPGLPGDQYRVKVSYFHPMLFDFQEGRYVLHLPTLVPQVCLAQGSSVNSVLDVAVTINTGRVEEVDLVVPSHPITVKYSQKGSISFELDEQAVWDNCDFVGGYRVWRDQITATVHVEPPQPGMPDQRGTFALSMTPPGPEHSVAFPRSIVFMFDRSGSMAGDPIKYAKAALLSGLNMLGEQDSFTVVAFDHEQLWWTDRLIAATPDNKVSCMHWVNNDLSSRGTTDIKSPLQRALKLLSGAAGLPLVFMLTDGCVDDEREICQMAESTIASHGQDVDPNNIVVMTDGSTVTAVNPQQPVPQQPGLSPRVYTFGIGPYCNHYFLKRLAAIGRGMNDVAFRPHAIQPVMERMLAAAALPMLSDVQISIQGLDSVELYPFPIPDVFVGQPLLVSGKFEGDWPETVDICGILPDSTSWSQTVPSLPAGDLPLQKIFIKGQLDLMTANAWMAGNPPNLVQQIVDLSVASGVTSAHTTMVGFETTPEKYEQMQALPPSERRKRIIKWAIGGAAGIAVVAGVAAALTFGDLASTLSNLPVGDAMGAGGDLGNLFGNLGDMGGCDCCGECCGDCGDLCGACLTC